MVLRSLEKLLFHVLLLLFLVNESERKNVKEIKLMNPYPMNRDCSDYRSRYPLLQDAEPKLDKNIRFYSNELQSKPNPGGTIDEILLKWHGNFHLLESHHGYIQWLFPTRVQGRNSKLHPLQKHEAEGIANDRIKKMRMLKAYQMMLHFYGLRLADSHTGKVVPDTNFDDRLMHLLRHPHNFLRITRIIQSLGEVGWGHLQRPLVELFIDILLDEKRVKKLREMEGKTSIKLFQNSLTGYWVNSILDDTDWHQMQARASPLVA